MQGSSAHPPMPATGANGLEADTLEYDRPPFVMVPVALVGAPPMALAAYLALGAFANGRTGAGVFPGVRLVAERMKVGRTAAEDAMRWLREHGWLQTRARYRSDGGQTSNAYRLLSTPRPSEVVPAPRVSPEENAEQEPAAGGGAPAQGGTPPPALAGGPPPPGRGPRTRTTRNQSGSAPQTPPRRPAAPSAPEQLPGLEVATVPAAPRRDGGALVAAWAAGYAASRNRQPSRAECARVAATARRLAQDDGVAWEVLVDVAASAGARGFLDLVRALADSRGPATGASSTGASGGTSGILARAMERAVALEERMHLQGARPGREVAPW